MKFLASLLLFGSIASAQTTQATQPTDAQETALSDVVQLTSGFARAGEAYFSPDMRWIVFQATPPGQAHYQMYLAKLEYDGQRLIGAGEPKRISPDDSRNTCGYFAPDGKTLIYASTAGKEQPDDPAGGYQRKGRNYAWSFPKGMEVFRVEKLDTQLKGPASVGAKPPIHAPLTARPLTDNDVYDAECAISPNGRWICYTSGAGKDADIYVMPAIGGEAVKVVGAPGYDGGPFFSPDGKRLVYRSDRKGNDLLQIFTCELAFDAGGSLAGMTPESERQLTHDENVNWGPYWHPDGRHIVYATSAHGHQNYELYLMRDDGTQPTRVTFKEGADVLPVFSPDGKWLMWTSKRSTDGTTQVFAARFTMPAD